tara:strand:- start:1155 stop:2891 length:1737 start_codon:yes stop_codon:yes gene_type:complete
MKLIGGTFLDKPQRRFVAAPLHPFWFEVGQPIAVNRVVSGESTEQETQQDTVVDIYTPAVVTQDFDIPVVGFVRTKSETITIASNNPAVATIVENRAVRVSDGSATITVSSAIRGVSFRLTFGTVSTTTQDFSSWAAGTLAKHCSDAVDLRLASKSAATALRLFTTQNHAAGSYVRNPDFWAGGSPVSGATASYVSEDSTTDGSWIGTYGGRGYRLGNGLTSLPSQVLIGITESSHYNGWEGFYSGFAAALELPGGGTTTEINYTGGSSFNVRINAGLRMFRVSFYCWDADGLGRSQRIDVKAHGTSAVLATRSISAFIANGRYVTFDFTGDVDVVFTNTTPGGGNAVLAGIFFDNSPTAPVDLTCISPWNSAGGGTRAGALITKRHIIFAAHYPLVVGSTIRFIGMDNTVYTRTVVATRTHPLYSPYYPDLTVAVLDSDLPEAITPCKVFPDTLETYLPNVRYGIPSLGLDQEEKGLVTDLIRLDNYAAFGVPSDAKRLEFYESKIGGDSGNPSFLIVNGELVLLTVWTYGGAGSGTDINDQLTAINTLIAGCDADAGNGGTGYTVSGVDLSGFPSY